MEIETFTGGVASTNAYLIKCEDSYLAVDAPEGFFSFIQDKTKSLAGLVLTHGHFDHIWDAATIAESYYCPVYYHQDDLPMFENPDIMSSFGLPPGVIKPVKGTHSLDQGDSLDFAPWSFKVLHIPGHSPGHICLYEESQKQLFGGDVLFAGSIGRTDFPGCSHEQLILGIKEKLFVLPSETSVYPGHGPETTIGEEQKHNPFLQD